MNEKNRTRVSKRLSRHLRHDPGGLGLTLSPGGWVPVDELLAALARNQFPVSRAELDEVVANCAKQRFGFDETGTLIRASQGHSVRVDLELSDAPPPEILFHGTATRFLPSIQAEGLRPMKRHAVHLSATRETAWKVGSRHGKPVVLTVAAGEMAARGHVFQVSDNGVWLTSAVPAEFLTAPE
ncbi:MULTISPECIES: RNA 2'-phosphotransferase [unclassified Amycolatopsis]|uniref:RNA 2'-phosphotransferase n=1 Tax=unclassified Amycolatopsis TaxID=2618356 RepID=UPI00106E4AC4|nr:MULTISPECIES: RNA 2'-phosphotransferase [unclassified Amycolatopsis]